MVIKMMDKNLSDTLERVYADFDKLNDKYQCLVREHDQVYETMGKLLEALKLEEKLREQQEEEIAILKNMLGKKGMLCA